MPHEEMPNLHYWPPHGNRMELHARDETDLYKVPFSPVRFPLHSNSKACHSALIARSLFYFLFFSLETHTRHQSITLFTFSSAISNNPQTLQTKPNHPSIYLSTITLKLQSFPCHIPHNHLLSLMIILGTFHGSF